MTESQLWLLNRLRQALAHAGGTHELIADVVPMLEDGRAQWWQRGRGVAITEIRDHPQLREVNVWLTAGHLPDCLALQPEIEAWARKHGVARIVGTGRDGWGRVCVNRMGFQRTGVHVEKWLGGPAQ
ncbi:MAG TPA: hypothetical protein VGR63_15280 [Casimicrobiaceae bacterium]|nr:hypothetical protein [Casimicrobiaceae bacterium]